MSSLPDKNEGQNFVVSEFVPIFLHVRHGENELLMLKEEGCHPKTGEHLGFNLTMRVDRAAILQAQAIKLSKVANISTSIVRNYGAFVRDYRRFVNLIKALESYDVAFSWQNKVFRGFLDQAYCGRYDGHWGPSNKKLREVH